MRHSEERFRQIAENLPGTLWVADLHWEFLYVSPGYAAVYRRPVREFVENQRSFLEFLHPEDRERVVAEYRTRPPGVAFEEEFRVLLPDGSVNWVRNQAFPVRSADGRLEGMTGLTTNITESRRVQEDLSRSVRGFQELADTMPQIVWAANVEGVADYYNRQWYDFTGLAPGTVGNERWGQIVHPEDLKPMMNVWGAAMRSGETYEMECRLRRVDGVYRWFLARARPVRNADGRIERWFGTSTDITERKEAETAFAATAERLRLALEVTGLGTWDWNIKTDHSVWSPEHNTMFDLPREQRAGNHEQWLARLHPEDRERSDRELRVALAERRDFRFEIRAVHQDGSVHWIVSNGRAYYDAAGQPARMLGVVRDITADREASAALRESEQRFRLANFHSPLPIMLFTDDGEILQVNEAWVRLTGYTRQELVTVKDWLERACPTAAVAEKAQRSLARFSREPGASVESPDRRIRCADGTERIWDMSIACLGRLPDGRSLRILSSIDVTTRRHDEIALRQAKEEAERANAAKSLFLSRMSHELRTPLNAILGFGQVLSLSTLEEREARCVDFMLKAGKHLLALVDEILDLARVDTGGLVLKLGDIRFDLLARECVGFTSKMAQARDIRCTVEAPPAECRLVWADEQRLRQVLLNLLSNAIKYNREGGTVTIRCEPAPRDRLSLSVSDTGPGISPEDLGRLFVPFERLGHEYGEVEGSGLGLVVSRRLAEAMDGSLTVQSEVGQGSTFRIELPRARTPAEPAALAHSVAPSLPGTAKKAAAATLLYVEDNESNVQVMETVVARLRPQWRFLSAKDGQAGLARARENAPDLILLDLQLPGLQGDAVLTELRRSPGTAQTPVLILSADATAHSRERLLSLGANGYVSKPFNVPVLLAQLDALLPPASGKKRRRARQPRRRVK